MSFTSDVKDELSHVEPKCKNCTKATLTALFKSLATLTFTGSYKFRIDITTDNASIARFVIKHLHSLYDVQTEIIMRRNVLQKATNYLIELTNSDEVLYALYDMGIVEIENKKIKNFKNTINESYINRKCCRSAYLCGVFLGGGYVNDPRGSFHLEIVLKNNIYALQIRDLIIKCNIKCNLYKRRNQHVVYIKSGQGITDFLALTGAHMCALAIENIRVIKSIKTEEWRRANVEIANSKRSTDAAIDQLMLIKNVAKNYDMSKLSLGLKDFIALRVKYPSLSLKELGEKANPPLSKSAVNGRLRRLKKIANEI